MAMDFPNSPYPGQQFTVGPITWVYVNGRWEMTQGGAYLNVTPWQPLTMLNGWVNIASGDYPAEWRMFGDSVELRGLITNPNSLGTYTVIAQVPPAGHPSEIMAVAVGSGSSLSGSASVDVAPTGNLRYRSGGTPPSIVSLSGVRYSTTAVGVLPTFSQVPNLPLAGVNPLLLDVYSSVRRDISQSGSEQPLTPTADFTIDNPTDIPILVRVESKGYLYMGAATNIAYLGFVSADEETFAPSFRAHKTVASGTESSWFNCVVIVTIPAGGSTNVSLLGRTASGTDSYIQFWWTEAHIMGPA